jgi:hypothetical protein
MSDFTDSWLMSLRARHWLHPLVNSDNLGNLPRLRFWQNEALLSLRQQVSVIILVTIFLFIGIAACLAAVRHRGAKRILVWFGIFSTMYGLRLFAGCACRPQFAVGTVLAQRPGLDEVIRENRLRSSVELSDRLLSEIRYWHGSMSVMGTFSPTTWVRALVSLARNGNL